jgi:hypothetical protein
MSPVLALLAAAVGSSCSSAVLLSADFDEVRSHVKEKAGKLAARSRRQSGPNVWYVERSESARELPGAARYGVRAVQHSRGKARRVACKIAVKQTSSGVRVTCSGRRWHKPGLRYLFDPVGDSPQCWFDRERFVREVADFFSRPAD